MSVRIGLIARADNSGLGVQTHGFYRHMQPAKTMVVDISRMNGNKIYPERYPDATIVHGFPRAGDVDRFLADLDVVFIAEAAYNPYLYTRAKELGVKTANQYNYEFFDWFSKPELPKPDMMIAPSMWHYAEVQNWCEENNIKHDYLHCPVDRTQLPYREIQQARTFLHVAGRSAAHDRNGTETVIMAAMYLETDAKIIIHFQGEQGLAHQATKSVADYQRMIDHHAEYSRMNIELIQNEYDDYKDVYARGDVLLLPRRYGGNCLPMNEALSVGMPVVMTDISPNNTFLPHRWLLPATIVNQFTPRTTIDIYDANPRHLARKIDYFYNLNTSEMLPHNVQASNLAEKISWENMKHKYITTFEELCNQ